MESGRSPIGRPNFFDDSCVSCRCHPGRAGDVCPCSGHPKRRKRQEHAGGRNCSRSDGERGARLNGRFAFVLNQTPPRGCRLSEAATSLNSLGVLALPYVGQRNDHQDALGVGLGVTEFAQEGRASEEVRELWRWVLKKLVEGSLDHEQHGKKAAC